MVYIVMFDITLKENVYTLKEPYYTTGLEED